MVCSIGRGCILLQRGPHRITAYIHYHCPLPDPHPQDSIELGFRSSWGPSWVQTTSQTHSQDGSRVTCALGTRVQVVTPASRPPACSRATDPRNPGSRAPVSSEPVSGLPRLLGRSVRWSSGLQVCVGPTAPVREPRGHGSQLCTPSCSPAVWMSDRFYNLRHKQKTQPSGHSRSAPSASRES